MSKKGKQKELYFVFVKGKMSEKGKQNVYILPVLLRCLVCIVQNVTIIHIKAKDKKLRRY